MQNIVRGGRGVRIGNSPCIWGTRAQCSPPCENPGVTDGVSAARTSVSGRPVILPWLTLLVGGTAAALAAAGGFTGAQGEFPKVEHGHRTVL